MNQPVQQVHPLTQLWATVRLNAMKMADEASIGIKYPNEDVTNEKSADVRKSMENIQGLLESMQTVIKELSEEQLNDTEVIEEIVEEVKSETGDAA